MEHSLVHGEGDRFGEPFRLRPDQKLFLYRWYEHHPTTGAWRYRRCFYETPKGVGKTELAAACGLAEFCGPVAPPSPNVPVAAASWEQADLLYGRAMQQATNEHSRLRPFLEPFEAECFIRDKPGRMFRIAAVAGTNEGGLPTLFMADEIHEWEGRKERLHLVVGNSLTKRSGGREFNLSTPGADVDSLAGRVHTYGAKVEAGEVDDDSFLFFWLTAPTDVDLSDEELLRDAIHQSNPQTRGRPDLTENIVRRYHEVPEYEFRRYHLAQWVEGGGDRFMSMERWAMQARPDRKLKRGEEVVLFFDGSYRHDSTGIVAETLDGFQSVVACWESADKPEDWVVPRDEVDAAVAKAFDTYRVKVLACDPPGWLDEITRWKERYGEEVVIEWPTHVRSKMAAACGQFFEAVMAERVTHDGDARLARHMANAVLKETVEGAYIVKDHPNSPRKIDLAVCAVGAHQQVVELIEKPKQSKVPVSL